MGHNILCLWSWQNFQGYTTGLIWTCLIETMYMQHVFIVVVTFPIVFKKLDERRLISKPLLIVICMVCQQLAVHGRCRYSMQYMIICYSNSVHVSLVFVHVYLSILSEGHIRLHPTELLYNVLCVDVWNILCMEQQV